MKSKRDFGLLYLNFVYGKGDNKTNYKHDSALIMITTTVEGVKENTEIKLLSYIRFDVQSSYKLDIKLCATCVNYEDIFESFIGSSTDIYYIEYLENLKFKPTVF